MWTSCPPLGSPILCFDGAQEGLVEPRTASCGRDTGPALLLVLSKWKVSCQPSRVVEGMKPPAPQVSTSGNNDFRPEVGGGIDMLSQQIPEIKD